MDEQGEKPPDREGQLVKWTNYMTGWQVRWFSLTGLTLSYYSSKSSKQGTTRGKISLSKAHFVVDSNDNCLFTVVNESQIFFLRAINHEERTEWLHALESVQKQSGRPIKEKESQVTILEKKLTEIDSCKKILMEQIEDLTCRLEHAGKDKEQYIESVLLIKDTANIMVSDVSQCSKILKDEVQKTEVQNRVNVNKQKNELSKIGKTFTAPTRVKIPKLKPDKHALKSASLKSDAEQDIRQIQEMEANLQARLSHSDNFFDANSEKVDDCVEEEEEETELTYDADVTDESDLSEDEAVEGQKSVVLALLSQLRIGMDLTKVTLPTFVLERRSLLEMYADFMSHPDTFSRIPDGNTEKDRFMNVVTWYLTAFHEGRKSSIAKKPYNPILGEVFFCGWTMDDDLGECRFVAEQVSHHPPVSAFYAENKKKNVCINSHIWTKSKFLGTSVGVQNIGTATLSLVDLNEEYTITWPDAYARSILTIPWVELCSVTNIKCEKTGFEATVEFLGKPTFGGEPHRLACTIRNPNKTELYKIEGKWNDILLIKDLKTKEKNLFAECKNLKVIKKRCAPLSEQGSNESRKKWHKVTVALKENDIDTASEEKSKLEQKQRADAAERKERGIEWRTKLFQKNFKDNWIYEKSIAK